MAPLETGYYRQKSRALFTGQEGPTAWRKGLFHTEIGDEAHARFKQLIERSGLNPQLEVTPFSGLSLRDLHGIAHVAMAAHDGSFLESFGQDPKKALNKLVREHFSDHPSQKSLSRFLYTSTVLDQDVRTYLDARQTAETSDMPELAAKAFRIKDIQGKINERPLAVGYFNAALSLAKLKNAPHLSNSERTDLANSIFYFYAPLLRRSGFTEMAEEMENSAFEQAYHDDHAAIQNWLHENRNLVDRERKILQTGIARHLKEKYASLDPLVESRVKSAYGIWVKMREKGLSIEDLGEIRDVLGLRIVVDRPEGKDADLFRKEIVPGLARRFSTPVPFGFVLPKDKDYYLHPKDNGYRALHYEVSIGDVALGEMQAVFRKDHEFNKDPKGAGHWEQKVKRLGLQGKRFLDNTLTESLTAMPKPPRNFTVTVRNTTDEGEEVVRRFDLFPGGKTGIGGPAIPRENLQDLLAFAFPNHYGFFKMTVRKTHPQKRPKNYRDADYVYHGLEVHVDLSQQLQTRPEIEALSGRNDLNDHTRALLESRLADFSEKPKAKTPPSREIHLGGAESFGQTELGSKPKGHRELP